jgi:hypothetical protein
LRSSISDWRWALRSALAELARERLTKGGGAAFGRDDPGAIGPRRIVANVLIVPALELRDPVLFFVLMKTDDASVHDLRAEERAELLFGFRR